MSEFSTLDGRRPRPDLPGHQLASLSASPEYTTGDVPCRQSRSAASARNSTKSKTRPELSCSRQKVCTFKFGSPSTGT